MASEKKNSNKLNFLNWILGVAIVLFFGLLIIYYFNIFDLDTTKKSDWGTFGDFIGGTLNPIFALFSLFAIIYTIKIQTQELEFSREELEETRKELKESRIAQQEQSESLKLQNKATNLQMFENTFFQLINLFIENIKNIGSKDINGKVVLSNISIDLKKESLKDSIQFKINYENKTGVYFSQIYQIIKFVDESNILDKQRYINIFKAQFTKKELELLFYGCLRDIVRKKFKLLVEEYSFFEYLSLNSDVEVELLKYDIKAFGENEEILKNYNKLSSKAQ